MTQDSGHPGCNPHTSPCGGPACGPQGSPWWCHTASAAIPVGVQHPQGPGPGTGARALVFTVPHRGGRPGCPAVVKDLVAEPEPAPGLLGSVQQPDRKRGLDLGTGGLGGSEARQAPYLLGASVSSFIRWSGSILVRGAPQESTPGLPSSCPRWFSTSAAPRAPGGLLCSPVQGQFIQRWFSPGLFCPQGTCGNVSRHFGHPKGGVLLAARPAMRRTAHGSVVWPWFPWC